MRSQDAQRLGSGSPAAGLVHLAVCPSQFAEATLDRSFSAGPAIAQPAWAPAS